MFSAELTNEFIDRVEAIKEQYYNETAQNIQQLNYNIEQKKQILQQSISFLNYISFSDEQGIILEELPMVLYNSMLEEKG